MQEPSIFTRIINGEIPCYKIYEDDLTFAFLDINPNTAGHTLVIPKKQVDRLYDLDDEAYMALMASVKKVAVRMQEVLRPSRVGIVVQGFDVAHAHVHVLPIEGPHDIDHDHKIDKPSEEEFRSMAGKLRF